MAPENVPPPGGNHVAPTPAKSRPGLVRRVVGWRFAIGNSTEAGHFGAGHRCGFCCGRIIPDRKHFCRWKTQQALIPQGRGVYKPIFQWFTAE